MQKNDGQTGKVFLLCSRRPIVAEFLLLAEAIAREADLETILVVPDGLEAMLPERLPERCSVVFTGPRSWGAGICGRFFYASFGGVRKLSHFLRAARFAIVSDFFDTWEAIARGRWLARHVLRIGHGGVAVLTADDRDIRTDQGVLRAARDCGIFTMVISFGKSDPDSDALRRHNALYDIDEKPFRRLKRHIARAYPASLRTAASGRDLLFFKPGDYWALKAHDLLFDVPWSYGGGKADRVGLLDQASVGLLQRMGVSPKKIFVAGQCSHDVLWATRQQRSEIRRELNRNYNFNADKPLLVLSMPPLGEHGITSVTAQLTETEFLLDAVRLANAPNVLISLHPRQDRGHYQALAARHSLAIAREPLRDILASADLFVAYSTTIGWAQLLGVPSIALEYFGLGYALFNGEPGVHVVTERRQLVRACKSLLFPGKKRDVLVAELDAVDNRGVFDGGVRRRIITEIKIWSRSDHAQT